MKPADENTLSPTQLLEIASQQKRFLELLVISIPVVVGTFCVPSITEPGPVMLMGANHEDLARLTTSDRATAEADDRSAAFRNR